MTEIASQFSSKEEAEKYMERNKPVKYELKEIQGDYPRPSKNEIKYHDRIGHPDVHVDEKGRKYIMVRKSGGGTKRLYEGQKYRPSKKSKETKTLVLD